MMLIFRIKKGILFFIACLFQLLVSAQPEIFADKVKMEYPDESAVIVDWREDIKIENGSELTVHSHNSCQIMHLSATGSNDLIDKIPYDPNFYVVEDISACTWIPNENTYKKLKVKEFKDMEESNGQNFYDGRRYKQIIYPNVQYGAITEYNYSYNILDPHSLGAFFFDFHVPVLNIEYTVSVPKSVEIGIAQFGDKSNIDYTQVEKGSYIIHTWKRKNSKRFKSFDFVQSDDHQRNHLFVYIKSYEHKNKEIVIQGNKEDLYKYNYGFIKDLPEEPSKELQLVVDSIKTKSPTQDDIAKGIYYWVQDNIRYIAFEDGLGGFIPRKANLVFSRKYGDCKDMASIIKTMMDYAHVPCNLCWVGTRSKGYTYDELPLPYCDNHMIAAYNKDGRYIYMDATSRHQAFGFPTEGIQGKQTMIAIDEKTFDTPFIPIVPFDSNFVFDTLKITLETGGLHVNGHSIIGGYVKNQTAANIASAGPQNEKKLMNDLLGRGYNKCKIHQYKINHLHDRDQPLEITFEHTMQDYARYSGDEIYINMNFDKSMTTQLPDTASRTCDADYEYAYLIDGIEELTVPDGYTVASMPSGVNIQSDYYTITQSYEQKSNKVIVHKNIQFKAITIPKEHIPTYSNDLNKLSKAYQQVVVLRKK